MYTINPLISLPPLFSPPLYLAPLQLAPPPRGSKIKSAPPLEVKNLIRGLIRGFTIIIIRVKKRPFTWAVHVCGCTVQTSRLFCLHGCTIIYFSCTLAVQHTDLFSVHRFNRCTSNLYCCTLSMSLHEKK